MKRVTIALDERMYVELLEYSGEKSRRKVRRYSISEAIRELVAEQLRAVKANPIHPAGDLKSLKG